MGFESLFSKPQSSNEERDEEIVSNQTSVTSLSRMPRSPDISFSDLRSAITGSMLSYRGWPGPRWYVKDQS